MNRQVMNNRLVWPRSGYRRPTPRPSPAKDYLRYHPETTPAELIALFGISRQQVTTIRHQLGLTVRGWTRRTPE